MQVYVAHALLRSPDNCRHDGNNICKYRKIIQREQVLPQKTRIRTKCRAFTTSLLKRNASLTRAYTPKFVQPAVTRHPRRGLCVLRLIEASLCCATWMLLSAAPMGARCAYGGARFLKPRAPHGVHECVAYGGHVSDVTALHGLVVTGDSNLHKLRYNARVRYAQGRIYAP